MSDEDDILDELGVEPSDDADGADDWAAAMEEQEAEEGKAATDDVFRCRADGVGR